jgi:hypothetical protein
MAFPPLAFMARLSTTFLTGSRTLPSRRSTSRPVTGGGLGRVAAVLVEAVLQLGDTV